MCGEQSGFKPLKLDVCMYNTFRLHHCFYSFTGKYAKQTHTPPGELRLYRGTGVGFSPLRNSVYLSRP